MSQQGFFAQAKVQLLEKPDLLKAGTIEVQFKGVRYQEAGKWLNPETKTEESIDAAIFWYGIYLKGPESDLIGKRVKFRSGLTTGEKSNTLPLFVGFSGITSPTNEEFYDWNPQIAKDNIAEFVIMQEKFSGKPYTRVFSGKYLRKGESDTRE